MHSGFHTLLPLRALQPHQERGFRRERERKESNPSNEHKETSSQTHPGLPSPVHTEHSLVESDEEVRPSSTCRAVGDQGLRKKSP
jgi:hypothetical protein